MFGRILLVSCALITASAAQAVSVKPTDYSMVNGNTGSYWYFDDSYSGTGNKQQSGALLSGGTGDLTDGVIAAQNWQHVEAPAGPYGPYVGWLSRNPTITFNFAQTFDFVSATFHLDDANGYGGVSLPSSISIDYAGAPAPLTEAVTDPVGSAPLAHDFDLSGVTTNSLVVTLNRKNSWVFLSEVEFDVRSNRTPGNTSAVPLPAPALLLVGAIGGLGLLRRRGRFKGAEHL